MSQTTQSQTSETDVLKPRMNIATSCNERYARYVAVNLINTSEVLGKKYDVHFYLIQSSVSDDTLRQLEVFSQALNLTFHNVVVEDDAFLQILADNARAPDRERYFDGVCHLFMPEEVDRLLYVDTGDVMFTDDAYDFYFEDFQGKSLLVTTYWDLKKNKWDFDQFASLWGGFNSGHMLINVQKLRDDNVTREDYVSYVEAWSEHANGRKPLFGGDQAFLTAFFAGDIATIEKKNPYNVKVVALQGKQPKIPPKSVHLNAMFNGLKPWRIPFHDSKDLEKYKITVQRKREKTGALKKQVYFAGYENECIALWWDYCQKTPFYDEIKRDSFTDLRLAFTLAKQIRMDATDAKPQPLQQQNTDPQKQDPVPSQAGFAGKIRRYLQRDHGIRR